MKIRYILTGVLLLLVTTLQAQNYGVAIGARGGLTIPSITPGGKTTPLSEGYSSRMAWGAGALAEFRYTKAFSIQIGLEYSSQGGLKNGNQAIPASEVLGPLFAQMGPGSDFANGLAAAAASIAAFSPTGAAQIGQFGQALQGMQVPDYLYADFKSEAKFNYVMLPVQAKWGWNFNGGNSPWRFYMSAGLFASYLISAERVSSGRSVIAWDSELSLNDKIGGTIAAERANVTDPYGQAALSYILDGDRGFLAQMSAQLGEKTNFGGTQDIYDELKKVNVGFVGNVGFQYAFGEARRNNIFIEGGGNYGFIKIQKEDVNGQNRIGAGTVMFGYSRVLGGRR